MSKAIEKETVETEEPVRVFYNKELLEFDYYRPGPDWVYFEVKHDIEADKSGIRGSYDIIFEDPDFRRYAGCDGWGIWLDLAHSKGECIQVGPWNYECYGECAGLYSFIYEVIDDEDLKDKEKVVECLEVVFSGCGCIRLTGDVIDEIYSWDVVDREKLDKLVEKYYLIDYTGDVNGEEEVYRDPERWGLVLLYSDGESECVDNPLEYCKAPVTKG